ncbi:hypothetical protein CPB97_008725 [Podila verticillata]|nr:hypothetical protein CPB97_008725 [Podila verticillata]
MLNAFLLCPLLASSGITSSSNSKSPLFSKPAPSLSSTSTIATTTTTTTTTTRTTTSSSTPQRTTPKPPTPAADTALAIPELLQHILFCLDLIELAAHDTLLNPPKSGHQRSAGSGTRPSSKPRLGSALRACSLVSKFWHLACAPVLWRRVTYSKSNMAMVSRAPSYLSSSSPQVFGRFLPGLVKNAPFIRHLKPWPGFLDRDLDLIGVYCGATLETLDLAFTRWGGIQGGKTGTTHRQESPRYMSLATTESLIELLPLLKRLKSLTLDSTIGLNMVRVLTYLTDLYSDKNNNNNNNDESHELPEISTHSRWRPLTRVDMDSVQNLDEHVFMAFLEACCTRQPALKDRDFYDNTTPTCIRSISMRRNDLHSFTFDFPKSRSPPPASQPAAPPEQTSVPTQDPAPQLLLEELALDETGLTDLGLINLSGLCPWLRDLSIMNNTRLMCESLEALGSHCPQLEKINLEGCTSIREWGFEALFGQCQKLKDLRLSNTNVTDAAIFNLLGSNEDRTSAPGTPTPSRPSSPFGSRPSSAMGSRPSSPLGLRHSLKAERIRSLCLSRCPLISDDSVNAVLARCSNLRILDISLNPCLNVTELFWHSTDSLHCKDTQHFVRSRSGTIDGSCHGHGRLYWACSQSLQVLNISSISYSMRTQPVSVKQSTNGTSRAHSRQGSVSSAFVPYSALYNQLQQLSGLQSLTMGSTDFVLDLYHDPEVSWSATASATIPSYSHGLVRVCQSLQRLQVFTLTKIDPLSSSLVGFRELRWMIQNMSSPSIRQLCVGQGVGLAVGFGNSLLESNRRSTSTRSDSLVFSIQDRMGKMDQVDRDMDNSEAFMAWCRIARPNLSIKVLEW